MNPSAAPRQTFRPNRAPRVISPARMGYLALFVLLFSLYTFTNSGRFHIIDEVSLYAVTESLALRGKVNTNAIAWTQWVNSPGEVLGAFGESGDVYSKKGPLPAFMAVPWFLLLRMFALLNIEFGILQGVLLWNGVITAVTALLLWNTATRLGYGERVGCGLGMLFGVATIAWPYANMFFGEPLSALALLLCFWGLLAWRKTGRNRYALAAGVGAAMAVATVTAHAPIVAAFAILAFVSMVRQGVPVPDYARSNALGRKSPPDAPDGNAADRNAADRDAANRDAADRDAADRDAADRDAADDENALGTLRFGIQVGLFSGPIMLAILFIFVYNTVRFGSGFATGYHFDSGEGFTNPILDGLWGLLFSPYRGVFWHTPLFVLSLVALPLFYMRHRLEATTIGAGSAILIGLYSMWWMWWGGFAWGPRFLVPFSPLWVLLLAPLLEAGFQRNAVRVADAENAPVRSAAPLRSVLRWFGHIRALGWLVVGGSLVSAAVQAAAVAVNFVNYEIELRGRYPTDWNDPLAFGPPALSLANWQDSPVFGQFRMLTGGLVPNTDLVWLWSTGQVRWLILAVVGAAILTSFSLLLAWLAGDRRAGRAQLQPARGVAAWLLPTLAVVVVGVWLGEAARHPHYGEAGEGYRAIVADICAQARDDDVLVTVAPFAYQIPMNWMGAQCRQQPAVLGYAADSLRHPQTAQALARVVEEHGRIWFVTAGLAPNDPDNTLERYLAETAHKALDTWYGDYRLLVYGSPQALEEAPWFPIATPLVGRGTSQVVILAARMPDVVAPDDVLAVEIYFELGAESPTNLRWFVQLLDATGVPVALLDTFPQDGYVGFDELPAEVELVERAGVKLPSDLASGDYLLIAGLYNPQDEEAARLRAPDGNDHVTLGFVRVLDAP